MQSITLQSSDSSVIESDVLGRLGFAASSESDGADSVLVAAIIEAVAEGNFTQTSNATSLVFSTASSSTAEEKLKIDSNGNFIPMSGINSDIGSSTYPFTSVYSDSFIKSGGTSSQYLMADGSISISSGGLADVVDDTSPQLGGNLDLQTYDITSDGTTGGDLKIGYITTQPRYYTLITDNDNTRVGINILSPSYTLDIGTQSGGNSSSAIRARNYIILNSFNITNGSNVDSSTTPMGTHYSPLVVGYGAKPFTSKCTSYATNYFSSAGDAQKVSMVVQYESTDATTKYLNAAKTGGYLYSTYVRNDTFILPPDSSATFTIHLIANNDTDSTSAGWIFRGCVKSVNKSLSFVGSPIVENFNDAGMSGAAADIEVQDGSGVSAFRAGGLLIKVNGLSGKTIRWVATIDAVLTSF
jgi:hypothetical protein